MAYGGAHNVLPQRQRIAGNGAVVACLRGDNAVQGFCDCGACMNVLPQRQLIAGNAAVVAKWEGVEWEQMFGSFRALHGAVRRFYPLRMEYGVERGCMVL